MSETGLVRSWLLLSKKKKIEKIRQGHYLKCIANLLLTLTLDQKQFVIKKRLRLPWSYYMTTVHRLSN